MKYILYFLQKLDGIHVALIPYTQQVHPFSKTLYGNYIFHYIRESLYFQIDTATVIPIMVTVQLETLKSLHQKRPNGMVLLPIPSGLNNKKTTQLGNSTFTVVPTPCSLSMLIFPP